MPLYPATDAEIPAIAEFANAAYRGDSSRVGWTTEADYLDGQRIDTATLRADLATKPIALLLTLRDAADGLLLGCVWLEPVEGDCWYLGTLTIRPGSRRTAHSHDSSEYSRHTDRVVSAPRLCAHGRDAAVSLRRQPLRRATSRRSELRRTRKTPLRISIG